MKNRQAVQLFHGPERFNCAQAVLAAFQSESGLPECAILAAAGAGGGRAKDGYCGALHAVRVLMEDGERLREVEREFEGRAGSTKCMEIRTRRTLPCSDCVALAAELMESQTNELRPDTPDFVSGLQTRIRSLLPVQGYHGCQMRN